LLGFVVCWVRGVRGRGCGENIGETERSRGGGGGGGGSEGETD